MKFFFVFGTPVSFVVLIFVTLTVTITFLLPAFTVIFAVPTFFPVITPLEFTAAILLLEELYVILSLLVTGFRTGFRVTFFSFDYTDCGLQVCDCLCSDSDCNQYIGLHATIQCDRHPC